MGERELKTNHFDCKIMTTEMLEVNDIKAEKYELQKEKKNCRKMRSEDRKIEDNGNTFFC